MKRNKIILLNLGIAAMVFSAITVAGAGFDLPDLDAFAVGRGMAVAATADNPSAIYFNPAGISQLPGSNLRGGIYGISLNPRLTVNGTTYNNQNQLHAIPQLYYTYNYNDSPITFGLGVYTPFGLGLEWADDSPARAATGGLDSSLTYFTINPVVAIKLAPALSVAGGITANYSDVDLKQGLLSTPANDDLEFKGHGWGVGYNLGVLLQPIKQLSFGVTFRSQSTINYTGHTTASIPGVGSYYSHATAEFNFPLEAVFAVSYRPTTNWNLEFDATYMDWNVLQSTTINQPGAVYLPTSLPVALNWQSSWYFEWGVTRYFAKKWHVSGGFIYSEDSVPTAYATPSVSDLDRYFFSAGVGYTGKEFDLDVAYQFGFGPPWYVQNDVTPGANGRYQFTSNAVAASVGWHF